MTRSIACDTNLLTSHERFVTHFRPIIGGKKIASSLATQYLINFKYTKGLRKTCFDIFNVLLNFARFDGQIFFTGCEKFEIFSLVLGVPAIAAIRIAQHSRQTNQRFCKMQTERRGMREKRGNACVSAHLGFIVLNEENRIILLIGVMMSRPVA